MIEQPRETPVFDMLVSRISWKTGRFYFSALNSKNIGTRLIKNF